MAPQINVTELIDGNPLSSLQKQTIALCFLILLIDGFDAAVIGFLAPAIRAEWALSALDLAPLFASGLLGLLVGAFLCGLIADKIGRKRTLLLCLGIVGLASLASAQSASLAELVIFRFITGIGLGGALPNAITLTSEYAPKPRRDNGCALCR